MKQFFLGALLLLAAGCGMPGAQVDPDAGDFAFIHVKLKGWTWSEEMMGLEKLLRGLYGTGPQLDMDKQFARVRVPKPMAFDFQALADGIKRNNVGTAGIEFQATVEIRDGSVVLQPTGQTFPLKNAPAKGTARKRMKVLDWDDPAKTAVEVLD